MSGTFVVERFSRGWVVSFTRGGGVTMPILLTASTDREAVEETAEAFNREYRAIRDERGGAR